MKETLRHYAPSLIKTSATFRCWTSSIRTLRCYVALWRQLRTWKRMTIGKWQMRKLLLGWSSRLETLSSWWMMTWSMKCKPNLQEANVNEEVRKMRKDMILIQILKSSRLMMKTSSRRGTRQPKEHKLSNRAMKKTEKMWCSKSTLKVHS